MNPGFGKGISKRHSGNDPEELINDPERLVKLARDYFSSDFPNSSRADCPAQSALDGLILSKALPEDELRAHLFGCSECFRDYRRLLALHSDTVPQKEFSWWGWITVSFRQQPLTAFASLITLAVCVIAAFFIWRGYVRETPTGVVRNASQPATISTSTTPQSPATGERASAGTEPFPAERPDEKHPSRGGDKKKERPPKELVASNPIKIDLEKYSLLRSTEGTSDEPAIRFPAALNRVILTLPINSPRGLYKISVVDAYGRELSSKRAASANGKTLTTDLDTRALSASKYRLCVSLSAEAPDCYPFIVAHK